MIVPFRTEVLKTPKTAAMDRRCVPVEFRCRHNMRPPRRETSIRRPFLSVAPIVASARPSCPTPANFASAKPSASTRSRPDRRRTTALRAEVDFGAVRSPQEGGFQQLGRADIQVLRHDGRMLSQFEQRGIDPRVNLAQ